VRDESPTPEGVEALLALSGLSVRGAAQALGITPDVMRQYVHGEQAAPRYVMHALRYLAIEVAAGTRPLRIDGMDEQRARKVLGTAIKSSGALACVTGDYFSWMVHSDRAHLSGEFSAEQLLAMAWWMSHHAKPSQPDGHAPATT